MVYSTLLLVALGCDHSTPSTPGEVFDAGPVFVDDSPKVSHTFTVKNTTERTIQIVGESHSCVCTKVEYEKRSLKPGETMPLTMEVAVSPQRTISDLVCSLRTDDPVHPTWTYRVQIQAYPRVVIDPPRIELGQIPEQTTEPIFRGASLTFYTLEELKRPPIMNVRAPDRFTAAIGETPRVVVLPNGVRETRFPVGFRLSGEDATTGSFAEPLSLDVLDTHLSAIIAWQSIGPLKASPSSLYFGMLDADATPKQQTVIIRSTKGSSFRLMGGDGGDPTLRVAIDDSADSQMTEHRVELIFDPTRSSSRRVLAGTATIQTDLNRADVCSVHWSAFLRSRSSRTTKLTRTP